MMNPIIALKMAELEAAVAAQVFLSAEAVNPVLHSVQSVAPWVLQLAMVVTQLVEVALAMCREKPVLQVPQTSAEVWVSQLARGVKQSPITVFPVPAVAVFGAVQAVQAVACPAAAQVFTGQVVQVAAPAAEKEPAAQSVQVGETPPAPYLPAVQAVHPASIRVMYPALHLAHLASSPETPPSLHLSHPFGAVARAPVQVVDWVLMN